MLRSNKFSCRAGTEGRGVIQGEDCSKQKKSNIANDMTSDLATNRCMPDNGFTAELNQVCRSEKWKRLRVQGQESNKPYPAAIHKPTSGLLCTLQ